MLLVAAELSVLDGSAMHGSLWSSDVLTDADEADFGLSRLAPDAPQLLADGGCTADDAADELDEHAAPPVATPPACDVFASWFMLCKQSKLFKPTVISLYLSLTWFRSHQGFYT